MLRKEGDTVAASVERLPTEEIPNEGDTLVRVTCSGVNYKDALAVTDRARIVRGAYPFVPGIDLVGTVVDCAGSHLGDGEWVIGTGWGLGEDHWGGYSEYQRVDSRSLVPLPAGMQPRVAATAGTAGLTAMLAAMAIAKGGVDPDRGEVIVTGASGGVGSLSVLFLSERGYRVVASTGTPQAESYLRDLGASRIIDRSELAAGPRRPLDSGRWAAAVDSVGGATLAAILSGTQRHGVVASCGLVGGADLSTTVYPFILRGVSLVGIDSNTCPHHVRLDAWGRVAGILTPSVADRIARTIELDDVRGACEDVLAGRVSGRLVVRISAQDGC